MKKLVFLLVGILILSIVFSGCIGSGDSDKDGLSDDEEGNEYTLIVYYADGKNASIICTSDPNKADTDGDGLNDFEELINSTNPRAVDTDDDGLPDYEEVVIYGTNPLHQDEDLDGLIDGIEINGWNVTVRGITTHVTSDVSKPDTDNDFLSDLKEYENRTNPLITDTDEDGVLDGVDLDPLWNIKVTVDLINFTLLKNGAKPYFYIYVYGNDTWTPFVSASYNVLVSLDDNYDFIGADISDNTGGKTFKVTISARDNNSQTNGADNSLKIYNSEGSWQTDYNIVDYPDEHEYSISGDDGILNFNVKIIRE